MSHIEFLKQLRPEAINRNPFPVKELLPGSLYYPSSGTDGQVVKYFGKETQSFFMSDYGVPEAQLLGQHDHFLGYEIFAHRSLSARELTPNGWQQHLPSNLPKHKYMAYTQNRMPYFHWVVYNRKAEYNPEHGPERFSLVYMGGEGIAGYQALYWSNRTTPKYLAFIQPGDAFGGNFTRYADPDEPMAWIVRNNPAGLPPFILYGGYGRNYDDLPWSGYTRLNLIRPYYGDGSGEVVVMKKN